MSVPTLHEIAAMPFSAGQKAVREHYDPHWGKELPEGKVKFRVQFDWTLEGEFNEEIEAESEEEAQEIAESMIHDDTYSAHLDISFVKIKLVQEQDA